MSGTALAPPLLCLALALALSKTSSRARWTALLLLTGMTLVGLVLPVSRTSLVPVLLGVSASTAVTAALVLLGRGAPIWLLWLLAANAGVWCGALASAADHSPALLVGALVLALAAHPLAFVAARRPVVLFVLASWLVAASILSIALPLTTTPGYAPDHMD